MFASPEVCASTASTLPTHFTHFHETTPTLFNIYGMDHQASYPHSTTFDYGHPDFVGTQVDPAQETYPQQMYPQQIHPFQYQNYQPNYNQALHQQAYPQHIQAQRSQPQNVYRQLFHRQLFHPQDFHLQNFHLQNFHPQHFQPQHFQPQHFQSQHIQPQPAYHQQSSVLPASEQEQAGGYPSGIQNQASPPNNGHSPPQPQDSKQVAATYAHVLAPAYRDTIRRVAATIPGYDESQGDPVMLYCHDRVQRYLESSTTSVALPTIPQQQHDVRPIHTQQHNIHHSPGSSQESPITISDGTVSTEPASTAPVHHPAAPPKPKVIDVTRDVYTCDDTLDPGHPAYPAYCAMKSMQKHEKHFEFKRISMTHRWCIREGSPEHFYCIRLNDGHKKHYWEIDQEVRRLDQREMEDNDRARYAMEQRAAEKKKRAADNAARKKELNKARQEKAKKAKQEKAKPQQSTPKATSGKTSKRKASHLNGDRDDAERCPRKKQRPACEKDLDEHLDSLFEDDSDKRLDSSFEEGASPDDAHAAVQVGEGLGNRVEDEPSEEAQSPLVDGEDDDDYFSKALVEACNEASETANDEVEPEGREEMEGVQNYDDESEESEEE